VRSVVIAVLSLVLARAASAADPPPHELLSLKDDQRATWGAPRSTWQVEPSTPNQETLTWNDFINEVLAANLDYAAARYDVDMAAADAAAARLLPNPHLSLSGDRDLTFHNEYGTGSDGQPALLRQVESHSVGFDQTIEIGGKRRWRSRVADQSLRSAAATLDDFLRNLKLDAASAYADALSAQAAVERLREVADFLARLEQAQQRRLASGDIGKPDLTQTQLEEARFRSDLIEAQTKAEAARLALATFLGRKRGQTYFEVSGALTRPLPQHDLAAVISDALRDRPDLIALRHARDAADSGVSLAKAARIPDIDLSLGYAHNDGVALNHPIDPTPAFNQAVIGVSIPIPLFDRGREGVSRAFAAAEQARVQVAAAELKAEVEIRAADAEYRSARQRLESYRGGILNSADELLEAQRFSYSHGAATLLELLEAQRSANETRADYEQALSDAVRAEIEFERAAGVNPDIAF